MLFVYWLKLSCYPPISVEVILPHKCDKFPCSEVLTDIKGGLYPSLARVKKVANHFDDFLKMDWGQDIICKASEHPH